MRCDTREASGVWTGMFQRDGNDTPEVPFSAWLTVRAGRLSGSTLEPNTFAEGHGDELDALVRGHIDEKEIVFIKSYNGLDQEPVYFEGEIMDHGNRIAGKWYFGWPDEISGSFEMTRDDRSKDHTQSATSSASRSD